MGMTHSHARQTFGSAFSRWLNRRLLWLAEHWLAVANLFFFTYVGLPILAPILLASGFTGAANTIYQLYNMVCHQLPTRAYFIFGEQVALCHRCVAIYVAFFAGGLIFNFARYKTLPFRWYLLFALPMALDGGTAFVSELAQVLPLAIFWILALIGIAIVWFILYRQQALFWQIYVVFAGCLLALAYLEFFGLRISNVYMRNITGFIFGMGTVWFAYPTLEESFRESWSELKGRLGRPDALEQSPL